jgi:hypothetical protein
VNRFKQEKVAINALVNLLEHAEFTAKLYRNAGMLLPPPLVRLLGDPSKIRSVRDQAVDSGG